MSLAANNSLGAVLTQMGRYAEAVTSLQTALELEPDYADAHGWLGYAYLKIARSSRTISRGWSRGLLTSMVWWDERQRGSGFCSR